MKIIMMKFMLLMASMTPLMKTPISMGLLLFIQTLMATLLISKLMSSSWMAMVIFIMLIGSLLILFMYMSSIACNEKFKMNYKILVMSILFIIPLEELLAESQINDNMNFFCMNENLTFSKIYNKKTMLVTIMMFMYMFLSMVVITKIVKIYKGPLRSK